MTNNNPLTVWDYPDNNFTYYSHPIGVLPRYLSIKGPGQAYLLNGMPERSNFNSNWLVYGVILQLCTASTGLLIHGLAFYTVWKNHKISKVVRLFFLFDAYYHINNSIYSLFTTQCAITWSCVDAHGYPYSWLLVNLIATNFRRGADAADQLISIGLSFNRFFAVYFNGLYYGLTERMGIPYILISWLGLLSLHLYPIGPVYNSELGVSKFTGYFFNPAAFTLNVSYGKNYFFLWIYSNIYWIEWGVLGVAIILDSLTFFKIRSMEKQLLSRSKFSIEFKMVIIMISDHSNMILQALFAQITKWIGFTDAWVNLLCTIPISASRLLSSVVIIYLMRPTRRCGSVSVNHSRFHDEGSKNF